MKKILILNGSFCEQPIIIKAKEMGYYVVTTGNAPELMGHAYADEYIPCDYSDKEAILQLVKDNGIEGIVSCANDFGTLTASYVCEQMGWKGYDDFKTASIIHHKDRFKRFCYENDILSPRSYVFTSVEEGCEHIKNVEYPIIVKATDLTGGKGILRADNEKEARFAIGNAISASREKKYVIEPFIEGQLSAFVVYIYNKEVVCDYSTSCYSVVNPYLIQYETMPAEGVNTYKDVLMDVVRIMIQSLDLADGILCLQYIVKDGQPYVIESMRRCFGNQFLTLATAFTGFPWEEAYIMSSVGQQDLSAIQKQKPRFKHCGYYGVMSDHDGTLVEYILPPEIEEHIFNRVRIKEIGDYISNHMNERVEYLHFQYDDAEQMKQELTHYKDKITLKVE